MRVGLGFSGAPQAVKDKIGYAKIAEEKGFDSVWVAEDYFLRDAATTLGALAANTRRMKLGTAVLNPYTRNPVLLAMTIATLDELSGGRAILGIGTSDKRHMMQMGIEFRRPVAAVRESVEIVRRLLKGETTYKGSVFNVEGVTLGTLPGFETWGGEAFKPVRSTVPIYIAAIGPKMLQLGGEIADGVILPAGTSTHFVRYAAKNIRAGAARSRRDPREVVLAGFITSAASEESGPALDAARGLVALLSSFGTSSLSREGNEEYLKPFSKNELQPIRDAMMKKGLLEAAKEAPDEMVRNFAAVGTKKEVCEKLLDYEEAGLNLAIMFPVGPDVSSMIEAGAQFLEGR